MIRRLSAPTFQARMRNLSGRLLGISCIAVGIVSGLAVAAVSMTVTEDPVRSSCASPSCLREDQFVRWYAAWHMKRDLRRAALLLDVRKTSRVGSGSLLPAFDAHIPFVEFDGGLAGRGAMRFSPDFANRVDDVVRDQGLKSSDPIALLCDTHYCGELAALLLQERGYSNVYVVSDEAPRSTLAAR